MQVLCKASNTVSDVRCKVCGQGFLVYWSRSSRAEQETSRRQVEESLAAQHVTSSRGDAHPKTGFTLPDWPGMPGVSAAAVLGGAKTWSL